MCFLFCPASPFTAPVYHTPNWFACGVLACLSHSSCAIRFPLHQGSCSFLRIPLKGTTEMGTHIPRNLRKRGFLDIFKLSVFSYTDHSRILRKTNDIQNPDNSITAQVCSYCTQNHPEDGFHFWNLTVKKLIQHTQQNWGSLIASHISFSLFSCSNTLISSCLPCLLDWE